MDGGGVAQTGGGSHIITGRPSGQPAVGLPNCQVAAPADAGDHPAVPVFDPVGGRESESAVVRAGDDHISDTRPVLVSQEHLPSDCNVAEAMIAGSAVKLSDELAGRSEHDRVESDG